MNILLIILAIIIVPILLLLVIGLFTKRSYSVQRQILIDRSVDVVYNYVKYLRNQDNYSKWVMRDPGMKKEFKGTDGTPGFVYAWDSQDKNAGKGEQEIKSLQQDKSVEAELRFERPFKAVSDTTMTTSATADGKTQVRWIFASTMKYPMNVMLLMMNFDKVLGGDMDSSLARLKGILEGR